MPQIKLDKQSKLNRLISLLNGSISFNEMRAPKFFFAFFNGTFYQVEGLKMEKPEFNKWKADNVREMDSLQVFEEKLTYLSPEAIIKQADKNYFLNSLKETSQDVENVCNHLEVVSELIEDEITPISQAEKKVRKKFHIPDEVKIVAKEIEKVKKIITVKPTRKTSGLMSEYGITWGVSDPSLYNKTNYSPLR